MFTDALGNVHWEFWGGIRLNGRHYQSVALFALCRELGTHLVQQTCVELDTTPNDDNLEILRKEIEQNEKSLV